MTDVAERTGVSLKRVFRVVNGEPGVTAATTARVRGAIVELAYRRNNVAHALRWGQRFRMLGLVIEDVANPFCSAIARAVEEATRERGQRLIMAAHPPSTVSYDAADLGREAARLLTARLEGDDGPTQRVIQPTQLVHRGLGEAA